MALKESKHLGLPDHKNDTIITLTEWITTITIHMRNTSMDAVFFVQKDVTNPTYIDLLEEWNQCSNKEINQWLSDKHLMPTINRTFRCLVLTSNIQSRPTCGMPWNLLFRVNLKDPKSSLLPLFDNIKLLEHPLCRISWPKSNQ